jgi:hypothetical protein
MEGLSVDYFSNVGYLFLIFGVQRNHCNHQLEK